MEVSYKPEDQAENIKEEKEDNLKENSQVIASTEISADTKQSEESIIEEKVPKV